MQVFTWIVTLILDAIGIYTFYIGSKAYNDYKKSAKVYKENHKDAVSYDFGKTTRILEIILLICCFLFAFIAPQASKNKLEMYNSMLLYLGLVFMVGGMYFDTYVNKKIILSQDSFFFSDDTYKYKLITRLIPSTGRFKPVVVVFGNNKELSMSKKVGEKLEEQYKEWKANRKANRKGKRNRKAAANQQNG